jgi:hypothetical protein
MTKLLPVFASLALIIAAQSCGRDGGQVREAWNATNDPLRLQGSYERKLGALPIKGTLDVKPWSDTYWPSSKGGVAARWFNAVSGESAFSYKLYTLAEIKTLSQDQLKRLSPAEKFDIIRGKFDYPTVKAERARTKPTAESWEGLCHGWAPAAMLFSEPKPIVFDGANGVKIPFGSSDVKALLTLYQGNIANLPAKVLGSRCNQDLSLNPADRFRAECKDTNAGAFHVVVTNQLGLMKKAFLADVTTDREVWNQPIHSFQSQIVSYQAPTAGAAPGTVKEAVVQTTMGYTVETAPSYNALNNTSGHADAQKSYRYRVELNANDEILGGEWITADRPDFLWLQDKAQFTGEWQTLGTLYQQSTNGTNPNPTPSPRPTITPTVRPTVTPTYGPTPVPTYGPTPVPTYVPPYGPTPVPTYVPGNPTYPGVQEWEPVSQGYIGQDLNCPQGLKLLGNKLLKVTVCAGGNQAQDSFPGEQITQGMMEQCVNQGLGSSCEQSQWNFGQYTQFRGSDECPLGTSPDRDTGYCREGSDLMGPFAQDVVQGCQMFYQNLQQSSSVCSSSRLNNDFVSNTLGIKKGSKGGWSK